MVALLGHSQRKTERQYVGAMKPRNRREMLIYGREGGHCGHRRVFGPVEAEAGAATAAGPA